MPHSFCPRIAIIYPSPTPPHKATPIFLYIGVEHELNVKKMCYKFPFWLYMSRYFLLLLWTQILLVGINIYLPILCYMITANASPIEYIVSIKYHTYTHNQQQPSALILVHETTGGIEAPKFYTQPLRINKLSEFKNTLNN